jgi:hypothetical protein
VSVEKKERGEGGWDFFGKGERRKEDEGGGRLVSGYKKKMTFWGLRLGFRFFRCADFFFDVEWWCETDRSIWKLKTIWNWRIPMWCAYLLCACYPTYNIFSPHTTDISLNILLIFFNMTFSIRSQRSEICVIIALKIAHHIKNSKLFITPNNLTSPHPPNPHPTPPPPTSKKKNTATNTLKTPWTSSDA